ncbi:MAG: ABC transporter permease [Deltaproteobacteria bacterium]|nr:ABC transporter permease [Deltaproteobacteria bacterium]
MRKILAIATNTFKEAIRDRILYGFLFFAVTLILFSLVLGQLSFNEEIRCTVDVGMAGISFFSVLMSVFLGITLLHKEIEKRTLYPVLSKPVSRPAYLTGKFLGLVLTMAVEFALMVGVFLAVLAIQGGSPTAGLAAALVLCFVEIVLVIAMALFFTSFSSPFLSGLFCLGLFVAGRNADMMSQLGKKDTLAWLKPTFDAVGAVIPNFNLFYPSGKMVEGSWATIHDQFVTSGYMASTILYGLAYAAALLLVAIILFRRRDFI